MGRDYLIQKGVAAEKIVSESRSETTLQNVNGVAAILRRRGARTCIAVSDGFHLYRIKLMFSAQGMTAYGSPVPASPIETDPMACFLHSLRETFISTLWYVGIHR